MGEYKLWELASTRAEVYELAQQVVEDSAPEGSLMRGQVWDEPSQTFVYAVHNAMLHRSHSKDRTDKRPPFTHVVKGIRVSDAAFMVVPKLNEYYSDSEIRDRIIRATYSILSRNLLLKRVGQTGGSKTFYIREWPEGFVPSYYKLHDSAWFSAKDEADLMRQSEKAVVMAGPVESHYDIATLPLPGPDPEDILEYVRKILPIAKALQVENAELRDKIKSLESHRWTDVAEEIKDLIE